MFLRCLLLIDACLAFVWRLSCICVVFFWGSVRHNFALGCRLFGALLEFVYRLSGVRVLLLWCLSVECALRCLCLIDACLLFG